MTETKKDGYMSESKEEIGMPKKHCSSCGKNRSFVKCEDVIGDPSGVEGVNWYACPDLVCENCGEEVESD